jgi:hypothetical protein
VKIFAEAIILFMKSAEEELRRHVEERQRALREKVNDLKQRLERIKRMGDIKSVIKERPGVVFAGSVLTAFMLKKMAGRKNRNRMGNGAYRRADRNPGSLTPAAGWFWDPAIAIISALASRTAIGIGIEIGKKLMPQRHENWRSERNVTGD